jgi:glycosyltransferase involved in cell wall biosynthesis
MIRMARRLRIALLTNSVAIGGMEKHVVLLAKHLDREEFEVLAIAPDWAPTSAFTADLREAADRVELVTPDRRYGARRQVFEAGRLTKLLRDQRIDVVHLHSTTYTGQGMASLCARLGGVHRTYITEHLAPDAPLGLIRGFRRNRFSRSVDGVVCVSERNRASRAAYIFTPPERTIVVANGVDTDEFPTYPPESLDDLRHSLALPEGAPIVGTVVRFESEKGLDDLLAAFAIVVRAFPAAHLLMVGDGTLKETLHVQAEQLGIATSVRFCGFQSDPRPYLALMDAFVLPVPVGSMSIGLLEAMAMRRAVVITFGGAGEAVLHGESGFNAEPRNPVSIAACVTDILADPDRRDALGAAARTRVEKHFSAEQVARTLGHLYNYGLPYSLMADPDG